MLCLCFFKERLPETAGSASGSLLFGWNMDLVMGSVEFVYLTLHFFLHLFVPGRIRLIDQLLQVGMHIIGHAAAQRKIILRIHILQSCEFSFDRGGIHVETAEHIGNHKAFQLSSVAA